MSSSTRAGPDMQTTTKMRKVGREIVGLEAGLQYLDERTWEVALQEVPYMLGVSRCFAMRRTCKAWARSTQMLPKHDAVRHYGLSPLALLNVLGSPGFTLDSLMVAEDDVYSVLTDHHDRARPEFMLMLNPNNASQHDRDLVAKTITEMRPKCALPPNSFSNSAVDVIFQFRGEREKMVVLQTQPIHLAVIHKAHRLVRMLLAAAAQSGVLAEILGNVQTGLLPSPSLMFLAVVFADKQVVDSLKAVGAKFSSLDQTAVERLRCAGMWPELQVRMGELGLAVEAQHWDTELAALAGNCLNNLVPTGRAGGLG